MNASFKRKVQFMLLSLICVTVLITCNKKGSDVLQKPSANASSMKAAEKPMNTTHKSSRQEKSIQFSKGKDGWRVSPTYGGSGPVAECQILQRLV